MGSVCETLPEVVLNLTGPIGDHVRANLPTTPLVRTLGGGLRNVLTSTSNSEETVAAVLPAGLVAWGIGPLGEDGELLAPDIEVLCVHDRPGTGRRRLQGELGKLITGDALETYVNSLDYLPEPDRPPRPDDSFGGVETKDLAKRGTAACPGQARWRAYERNRLTRGW